MDDSEKHKAILEAANQDFTEKKRKSDKIEAKLKDQVK